MRQQTEQGLRKQLELARAENQAWARMDVKTQLAASHTRSREYIHTYIHTHIRLYACIHTYIHIAEYATPTNRAHKKDQCGAAGASAWRWFRPSLV